MFRYLLHIVSISLFILVNCGDISMKHSRNTLNEQAHLDGYDTASNTTIQTINLWKDPKDRYLGIISKANHEDFITITDYDVSTQCYYVETKFGAKGWVSKLFIKEKRGN